MTGKSAWFCVFDVMHEILVGLIFAEIGTFRWRLSDQN
jgi:hypothetical protein